MHRLTRTLSVCTGLALASLTATAAEPGYVDLGKLTPADGCDFVEVNVGGPLLKLASSVVNHDNPDVAALIRSLKHVRVNVVGYNESNRADTTDRVQSLRRELEQQGWIRTVTVKQGENPQDVAVYVKTAADDAIDGVVVTVLDAAAHQAVIVNVVGNIKPEQIAAIGRALDLEPLRHLAVPAEQKGT